MNSEHTCIMTEDQLDKLRDDASVEVLDTKDIGAHMLRGFIEVSWRAKIESEIY